jgi:leucyl-tRNA synthetase
VTVDRGAAQDLVLAAALAEPQVAKFVEGKEIRKVIFVPDRLINIVV